MFHSSRRLCSHSGGRQHFHFRRAGLAMPVSISLWSSLLYPRDMVARTNSREPTNVRLFMCYLTTRSIEHNLFSWDLTLIHNFTGCKILPGQSSNNTSLAWVDLSQMDEQGAQNGENENFWPNLGRWQPGVKMEDCDIDFGEGIYWSAP